VSRIKAPVVFIKAYVTVKKAAALANAEVGWLDEKRKQAIVQACDEILAEKLLDQFVVDVFQAGAGTSFNMNVNGVLANRALEILGKEKGDCKSVSPNDHVNMAQSTNDTFPTAIHISVLMALQPLLQELGGLAGAFEKISEKHSDTVKSGRTHLQDAVPVTIGQEFSAYASALRNACDQLRERQKNLYELALGGTAAGTGANAHPQYKQLVIAKLQKMTGFPLKPAKNTFEALQSCKPVQPGSSIMPGKVNPVMAECLDMVAFQVVGNDLAVSFAVQAGQLDLNVMTPVIMHNVLFSIQILTNYLPVFRKKCAEGITVDEKRCAEYLEKNPALATFLSPHIGYLEASKIAKQALEQGRSVKEIALEKGLLTAEELERILDLKRLFTEKNSNYAFCYVVIP
jgi:aspartate ammonia-lyase